VLERDAQSSNASSGGGLSSSPPKNLSVQLKAWLYVSATAEVLTLSKSLSQPLLAPEDRSAKSNAYNSASVIPTAPCEGSALAECPQGRAESLMLRTVVDRKSQRTGTAKEGVSGLSSLDDEKY